MQVSIEIPKDQLEQEIDRKMKQRGYVPANNLVGQTWTIDEFRKRCCGNKSANWVRTYIFDEFPETNYLNGSWCIAPHKTPGVKGTIIFAYEAAKWMQKNKRLIDWEARC